MSTDTAISTTETPAPRLTAAELTDLAQRAATFSASERADTGWANILAELVAGQQLLAGSMQLDWKGIQAAAKAILASFAPTKQAKVKAPKPEAIPGETYAIDVRSPSGEVITDVVAAPYLFAIFQFDADAWCIRSRVNSKAVAHSRCNTFRKTGVAKEHLVVVEVEGTCWQPAPEGAAEPENKPAKQQKARKATKIELVVPEIEAPDLTGQNFTFDGSERVHAPNSAYTGALCGAAKGKDPRQTDEPITCRNCERLKSLFALAAESAQ